MTAKEWWPEDRPNKVICTTCDRPIGWPGTKKCDYCWEVESRLDAYLKFPKGRKFVRRALVNQILETRETIE